MRALQGCESKEATCIHLFNASLRCDGQSAEGRFEQDILDLFSLRELKILEGGNKLSK